MAINVVPEWMAQLEDQDLVFIKKFLLASGSLKDLAQEYGVTYPTVRLRLDRLLDKVRDADQVSEDPYVMMVKRMVVDEKLDLESAKLLIAEFKKTKEVV